MNHIVVHKWEDFQTYKDRMPKWIKLKTDIVEKYDEDGNLKKFYALADSAKLTFLMLLARRAHFNKFVPYENKNQLGKMLGVKNINLQPLVEADFISIQPAPIRENNESLQNNTEPYKNLTSERERERERETEREREEKSAPAFSISDTQKKELAEVVCQWERVNHIQATPDHVAKWGQAVRTHGSKKCLEFIDRIKATSPGFVITEINKAVANKPKPAANRTQIPRCPDCGGITTAELNGNPNRCGKCQRKLIDAANAKGGE